MRKILSLFIAITMLMSLVPTFAFAESGYDIAIDFGNTTNVGNDRPVTSLDGSAAGYQIVVDESCNTVYDQRQPTPGVQQFSVNDSAWRAANATTQRLNKVTIEVPVAKAGYYNMKIHGATWYPGAAFYFYVDGAYAGLYDFDSKVNKDSVKMSTEKTLNTLYLDPSEDGKVKIMFAVAVPSTYYSQARALLKTLKLDYVGETLEYADFVHNIPSEMVYGETVSFTAHAVMSDGSIFRANNYKVAADGTAVVSTENSVSAAPGEASLMTVAKTSNDITYDGIYEGTITASGIGEETVVLTAMINGVPKTKEVKINVVEPDKAETVTLNLTATNLIYSDKTRPSADWKTNGFNIVFDKTTSYQARFMGELNHILMRNGTWTVWPNQKIKELMFTVEKVIPKAGNYDVYMQAYKWYAGSDVAVYVNGKYIGDYNCWSGTTSTDSTVLGDKIKLNSLYLPSGYNEISFRMRKVHYDEGRMISPTVEFVPATSLPVVSAIENKLAVSDTAAVDITPELIASVKSGDVMNIKTQVKMSDGNYRYFGYNNDGSFPAKANNDDGVYVTSTNSEVVEVSDVVCVELAVPSAATKTDVIDPTTTTFTLTAKEGGTADIIVTAIVDGKETVSRTTINVPENKPGEEVAEKVSIYITKTEGGSVSADKVAVNEVTTANTGETITAEATADAGYKFAYWKDSAGNVVSEASEYTFNAFTNTSIIAVFDNVSGDAKKYGVEFFDGNRDFLGFVETEEGATFGSIENLPNHGLTGYAPKGWSIAENAIINGILRAVALYEEEGKEVSGITFNNGTVENTKYDEPVSNTVEGAKTWYRDEKLVGYGDSYTYYVWGDTNITSSTEDVEKKLPIAVLDKNGDSYMLEYDNAGYTIVDAGILFGDDTHNTVNACYYKAKVKNIKAHGQFTAKKSSNTKYPQTKVRGYVMFLDGDDIRVIYAD